MVTFDNLSQRVRSDHSQMKEGTHDFLLLSRDSQDKLKERRRSVLSRRYTFKQDSQMAMPEQGLTPTDHVGQPPQTKPPVLKLTVEGFHQLQKKTRSVMSRKAHADRQPARASLFTATEPTSIAVEHHRMEVVTLQGGSSGFTPTQLRQAENDALLTDLVDGPSRDEVDSMARPHIGGKNWIWKKETAPERLRVTKRRFSIMSGFKRLWQLENVNVIEYRPIFTYYVTVVQLVNSETDEENVARTTLGWGIQYLSPNVLYNPLGLTKNNQLVKNEENETRLL